MVLMVSACGTNAVEPEKPVPPVQTVQTEQMKSEPTPAPEPEAIKDMGEVVEVEPVVNVEPVSEAEPEADPQEIYTFTDCNETVYATSTVNLRSGPGTDHDKVGSMGTGESVTRTGIGTGDYSSWSRVQLGDGSIVYVSSNYLSTVKPSTQQTSGGTTQNKTNNGGTTTSTSTPSGGSSDGEAWAAERGQGLSRLHNYNSGNTFEDEGMNENRADPDFKVSMG